MGELHLEIIVDRLMREFNVQANVGQPQVAYRETVTGTVTQEGRFVRQTGGRGQYGHVVLEIEPGVRGSGVVFENKVVGGTVPKEFVPAVEQGIREARQWGAGWLPGGREGVAWMGLHGDSSEMAFKIAASIGLKEAVQALR